MPSGLYRGQKAQDVAAYVGAVAGRPGVDTGALASAGGVTGTSRGGQAGLHRRRRLWQLPHAGGGRNHRDRARTSTSA